MPLFRKYDARGQLIYERHIEGPEFDDYLRHLPTTWPERRTPTGDMVPWSHRPARTAGVDYQGNLWISLSVPFTYVYDATGEIPERSSSRAPTRWPPAASSSPGTVGCWSHPVVIVFKTMVSSP